MPHKKRGAKKSKPRKPPERRGGKAAEVLGGDAVTASRNLDLMGDKPPYPVEG